MPESDGTGSAQQMWLLPAAGQAGEGMLADIAVCRRTFATYSYAVPAELQANLTIGMRVEVPYGRTARMTRGWCVRVGQGAWAHVRKAVTSIADPRPVLSDKLVELALWISGYYAWPPGLALDVAASRPPTSRRKAVCFLELAPNFDSAALTRRQAALVNALREAPLPRRAALHKAGVGVAVLKALRSRNIVIESRRVTAEPQVVATSEAPASQAKPCPEDGYNLTAAQQNALERIADALAAPDVFRVFLLFGVPGSGKTEVYVRAMRRVVAAGRQAILLVPEIALATQIVQRLARRFPRAAILHSRLKDSERARAHERIAAGEVDVVIGTRSAVFAPCPRLGLLIVDEEQEGSFKSLSAPYYHARDVAIRRGQLERVPVLLGSATPSLETWFNSSHHPSYERIELPERVPGSQLPRTGTVDISRRELGQVGVVLAPGLLRELRAVLDAGRQAILLHNRRGYATRLRCARCGLPVCCPRCGAQLVEHRAAAEVRCHRCTHRAPTPAHCPDDSCCGPLERGGHAIQRLEEELRRAFPSARLLRLDRDSMRRRGDYEDALRRFEAGEADVMLGTQMIAKGLDFPRVALVGVIDVDEMLALPDLRSSERTFQLLVQVAGRGGRAAADSVALIQTRQPEARVIQAALRLDYPGFAAAELELRRKTFSPPYARLVRLILADSRQSRAVAAAKAVSEGLRGIAGRIHAEIRVEDAELCVVTRVRGLYRAAVLVRIPRSLTASRLLAEARRERLLSPRVERFSVDVDPVDLL